MSDNCPVCKTVLNNKSRSNPPVYDCPRCGKFFFTFKFSESVLAQKLNYGKDVKKMLVLSHAIRKMQKKDATYEPPIDEQLIDAILKQTLPTLFEQKDILIRWIGDNIKSGGDYVKVNKYSILAVIGARDLKEFYFIFEEVKAKGIVINKTVVGGGTNALMEVTLTFDGWEYYRELKRGAVDSRKAFMAMKYGNPELDRIVDDHFRQAVADTGFELYRLDTEPKAGLIDDRLRVEIRNSRFLISDLTHDNNGAYWEAGYAEGLGKPVIYTCKEGKFDEDETHFDTNHHLTVMWDAKKIDEAIKMLKATIRATLPDEAKLSDD